MDYLGSINRGASVPLCNHIEGRDKTPVSESVLLTKQLHCGSDASGCSLKSSWYLAYTPHFNSSPQPDRLEA
jgi:hypothetical protein